MAGRGLDVVADAILAIGSAAEASTKKIEGAIVATHVEQKGGGSGGTGSINYDGMEDGTSNKAVNELIASFTGGRK